MKLVKQKSRTFDQKVMLSYSKTLRDEQAFVWLPILKFLVFFSVLVVILSYVFGVVVYPGTTGVRQITLDIPLGPKQGFRTTGLEPGYHWNIPFYSKIHIVPRDIQVHHIKRDATDMAGGLEVQTTDGSSVIVDVSILSRYFGSPGFITFGEESIKHGGPADLIQKLGASANFWNNTIVRVAIDELRRALGRLSTSEFYNPQKRQNQITEATFNINKRLLELGIKIEGVFIRRYLYQEERIDRAIFAKNLQDQEERLNAAASRFAEAQAKSEQVAAEWDAKIQTLLVDGANQAKVIKSQGNLYETEKVAEGDLVLAKAYAEVDKLKAEVFSKTPGSANYVAREMAPLVAALKGGIVNQVDPFNPDDWLKKFGIRDSK